MGHHGISVYRIRDLVVFHVIWLRAFADDRKLALVPWVTRRPFILVINVMTAHDLRKTNYPYAGFGAIGLRQLPMFPRG